MTGDFFLLQTRNPDRMERGRDFVATVRTHRPISAGHVQSLALVVCRCPESSEKVETEVDGGAFDSVCRVMVLPYTIIPCISGVIL